MDNVLPDEGEPDKSGSSGAAQTVGARPVPRSQQPRRSSRP